MPAASVSVGHDFRAVIEVSVGAFHADCLKLLDQVQGQQVELAIVRAGIVIARVLPPHVPAASAFGFMHGTVVSYDDAIAPDFDAWESGSHAS